MLVIIILGFLTHLDARRAPNKPLRVYKGTPDTRNEFPFAVRFQHITRASDRFCTGSHIAPRFVLTAAHCLTGYNPEKVSSLMLVAYGEYTNNETTLYTKVLKRYPHPMYLEEGISAYDIGLVYVEKEQKNNMAKLGAFDFKSLFGLPVKHAGFGLTTRHYDDDDPLNGSHPLQVGEGMITPCENKRPKYVLLCVSPKCMNIDMGSRPSDSGGPLLYAGKVVGVLKGTHSTTDGRTKTSDFTPVGTYLDWIHNTLYSVNKQ